MTVDAVLSINGKYAVCGACGLSLCRRDRVAVDPQSNSGRPYVHVLTWGGEWRLERPDDGPDYLARSESSRNRYDRGNTPTRRPPGRMEDGTDDDNGIDWYLNLGPSVPLARCRCGTLNRMENRRLHVQLGP